MSKIENTNQLPEWFKIENYQAADSFGSLEWYKQLAQRRHFLTLLEYRSDARQEMRELAESAFNRDIQYIRGVSVEKAHLPIFHENHCLLEHLKQNKRGVSSLTFRHLCEHARNLDSHYLRPFEWFRELYSISHKTNDNEGGAADYPLTLSSHLNMTEHMATALVDLNLPDDVLINGFTSWLTELRQAQKTEKDKRYHKPAFHRWARYGVLPFLDLEIWKIETKQKLPDRVVAAAIFPFSDFGEGNLRKTTKFHAQRLMNDLSELQALAALELSLPTHTP